MSDEQDGGARRLPDSINLGLHDRARLRIKRPERLVHQHHGGFVDQDTRDLRPLAHAAGEFVGEAIRRMAQSDQVQVILHRLGSCRAGYTAHARPIFDILSNR